MNCIARLGVALVGALGIVACSSDDGPTSVNPGPKAYIRYVNASPDAPALDARFTDRPENTRTLFGVAFRGNSGFYQAVDAGSRQMRVFFSSNNVDSTSTVVAEGTLELAERTYYTIVQTGTIGTGVGRTNGSAQLRLLVDTIPAATDLAATDVRIRVYNFTTAGPIDVDVARAVGTTTLATAATASNVAVGARSAYLTLTRIQTVPAPAAGTTAPPDTLFRFTTRSSGGTAALFSVAPSGALDVGAPYTPASLASTALDPIAGVRQGRSVMSLFVFGPGVAGTPTASLTTGTATLLADQNPPPP